MKNNSNRHTGARSALEMQPNVQPITLANKQIEEAQYQMQMKLQQTNN